MSSEASQDAAVVCPRCGQTNPAGFQWCAICQGELSAAHRKPDPDDAPGAGAPAIDVAARTDRRRRIAIELGVALLVIWLPLYMSARMRRDPAASIEAESTEVWSLLWGAGMLALIGYFGFLDGSARTQLGLRRPKLRDLAWAGAVLFALVLVSRLTLTLTDLAGLSADRPPPIQEAIVEPAWTWAWPLHWFVWAWVEEAFYRAYLWSRFAELTQRPWLSMVAVSLLFAVCHAYPLDFTIEVFVGGMLLSVMYYVRRSLAPLVVAHWLFNLLRT